MFTWHGLAQRSRPPTLVTLESTSPLLPNAVRSPSIHPVARPSSSRGSPEAAPWPRVTAEPGPGVSGGNVAGGGKRGFFFLFLFNYEPRWRDEQLGLWPKIQGACESDFSVYGGKEEKRQSQHFISQDVLNRAANENWLLKNNNHKMFMYNSLCANPTQMYSQ